MTDFGGLIIQKQVLIQYSSSSVHGETRLPKYMFDDDSTTNFCSQEIENSFFQIDFIDCTVKIQSYDVRIDNWNIINIPKSWNVTGYNGKMWVLISKVEESKLNNMKVIHIDIDQDKQTYAYSSIRVTSTSTTYVKQLICYTW